MALAKRIIASSITVLVFVAAFAFALCACPLGAYADEDKAATSADAGSVGSGLQGSWADWRPNPGDTSMSRKPIGTPPSTSRRQECTALSGKAKM